MRPQDPLGALGQNKTFGSQGGILRGNLLPYNSQGAAAHQGVGGRSSRIPKGTAGEVCQEPENVLIP